jgi:two-component system nitrogen regulation sensor histidine kinase GlnL
MVNQALYPIAENMPDPLFVFASQTGGLLWMNNAAEVWLRRPLSSMSGIKVAAIASGFSEIGTHFPTPTNPTASYRGHDLQVNVRRQDYICRYQVFDCPQGIVLHLEPKEMGIRLDQTGARDQPVIMLGKMLAHELKNPLAGIRGAAQLLESEFSKEEDLELTELIKTEVDRIGRLAERMESFGQIEIDAFKPFNVHEVLRKATLLFENQNNGAIEFIETFDPSLPDVFGDEDSIMQVIVNLLANAIEAIQLGKSGNRVELRTRYRTGISKRLATGNQHALPVEVQIIDNGPGIAKKIQDRMFQPFVTSKANGQGLGLALISKIIGDHDGLVEVVSEPGKTVFSVLLPVEPQTNKTQGK